MMKDMGPIEEKNLAVHLLESGTVIDYTHEYHELWPCHQKESLKNQKFFGWALIFSTLAIQVNPFQCP